MRINIIVPNFNKGPFLQKCLESCAAQNYDDFNIIFVDNESTDDSLEIARKFKESCKVDLIIDEAKNIYPHCWEECLEVAFKYCDGEYYTIVGSDDYILENYLINFKSSIDLLNKPKVVQSAMTWYQDGKAINYTEYKYNSIDEIKNLLVNGCAVNSPNVFYHSSMLDDTSLERQPHLYSGASDYDYFCQIVDAGIYITLIKDIGYCYNINANQATWQMHKSEISYDNIIKKKWKDKWNLNI